MPEARVASEQLLYPACFDVAIRLILRSRQNPVANLKVLDVLLPKASAHK
jgi:hypothetical protein